MESPVPHDAGPAPGSAWKRQEADEPEKTQISHDPSFGTLVYGTALSRDGTPIESCRISFTSVADSAVRLGTQVEGGHGYALTGLGPGRWRIYSKPTDFAALQTEVEIFDAPSQRVDLTFEPSFLITVKMQTPEGQPLHEAITEAKLGHYVEVIAVASRQPFDGHLPMTELRGHSRFGIGSWRGARGFSARGREPAPADVAGTLELSEPPPVHVAAVFRHIVLATDTVEAGEKEVVLQVPLDAVRASVSTVRLQVVDASTGLPVPDARVAISDSQSGGGGRPTDEQGRVTLENERVGILELDVYAKGLEHYHQLLRLQPGEHDLGVIRLHPATDVSAVVVDGRGKPAPGVTVQWQNLDRRTFPQPSMYRRSASTDAEGSVTLSGLGTGTYMLQAFQRGSSMVTKIVDTSRLGKEPVQLVLAPAYKVKIAATSTVPRTRVHCFTIFDRQRVPVWARYVRGYPTEAELPAGRYVWELHEDTRLLASGEFELRENADPPSIGPR